MASRIMLTVAAIAALTTGPALSQPATAGFATPAPAPRWPDPSYAPDAWQGGWNDGRWRDGRARDVSPDRVGRSDPALGGRLPSYFVTQRFVIADWQRYGLTPPARGTRWVRYYDDAVLVDGGGLVRDARRVAWDQYGAGPIGSDYDQGYDRGYDDGYEDGNMDMSDDAVTYGGGWRTPREPVTYQSGPGTTVTRLGPGGGTVVVVRGNSGASSTTTTSYETVAAPPRRSSAKATKTKLRRR